MVEPADPVALARLAELLGRPIVPYVVAELRALYYLEKLFGLPRRARFVRSGRPPSEADPEPEEERRRSQPADGMVMPPALTVEPRRRRASSQVPLGHAVPISISYAAACERIDAATHRDQIADTLVEYAKGRCDALIAFLIRDGNALGWRGYVAPDEGRAAAPVIDQLSLPLGGASALQTARDTGELFLGAPPSEGKPIETQLWTALGVTAQPATVLVVPILVKTRAVNLLYVHSLGGPPAALLVTELSELAARISSAYVRLIRQARAS